MVRPSTKREFMGEQTTLPPEVPHRHFGGRRVASRHAAAQDKPIVDRKDPVTGEQTYIANRGCSEGR